MLVWDRQTNLPAVPDRCRKLGLSGSSAGALDRISRPLILNTVPCGLGRCLPFVYNLLLTSTLLPHGLLGAAVMVSRVPIPEYTVLLHTTRFTPINNSRNLFPEDAFVVGAAKISLKMTNKFKRRIIIRPGHFSSGFSELKACFFGWNEKIWGKKKIWAQAFWFKCAVIC